MVNIAEQIKILLPQPIAIVGYGVEGQSTARFLKKYGIEFRILDQNKDVKIPAGITSYTGESFFDGLNGCKSAVRSAGIRPDLSALVEFQNNGGILSSQVELYFSLRKNITVGVTGTLGKGSCVSMIQFVLNHLNIKCSVGGNIGIPALDLSFTEKQIVVLELSSFQLMSLKQSPDIAVVLKTDTEHLDWHIDTQEYRNAKKALVAAQKKDDLCIYCSDSEGSSQIATSSLACKESYGSNGDACIDAGVLTIENERLQASDCKVSGNFQLENMAAASLVLRKLGVSIHESFSILKEFKGLQYRLQYSGCIHGVNCYNDSYATRPDATIGAIQSFKQDMGLILGGSEKNADFSELAQTMVSLKNLKVVVLIGATATRLQKLIESHIEYSFELSICDNLQDAIDVCLENLESGDVLLLSPACASFGLFKNYKERGKIFDSLIQKKKQERTLL